MQELLEKHSEGVMKSEDQHNNALQELSDSFTNTFPNIIFSPSDFVLLCQHHNNLTTNNSAHFDAYTKFVFGESAAHPLHYVSHDTETELARTKTAAPKLKEAYNNALSAFFYSCEKLNDPATMQDQTFDLENEVFRKIYEQGFALKAKNPILSAYYETYKRCREKEKENKTLETTVAAKDAELAKAAQTIGALRQESSLLSKSFLKLSQTTRRLQGLLKSTLAFCEHVKHSRFGKFFFRKQLKLLPKETNPADLEEI